MIDLALDWSAIDKTKIEISLIKFVGNAKLNCLRQVLFPLFSSIFFVVNPEKLLELLDKREAHLFREHSKNGFSCKRSKSL